MTPKQVKKIKLTRSRIITRVFKCIITDIKTIIR